MANLATQITSIAAAAPAISTSAASIRLSCVSHCLGQKGISKVVLNVAARISDPHHRFIIPQWTPHPIPTPLWLRFFPAINF